MKQSFGPWATEINTGNNPKLSTFWKRRMTMLSSLNRLEFGMDVTGKCQLGILGLAVLLLPLLTSETVVLAKQTEIKSKQGRIVFWRMHRLATTHPDGTEFNWLTDNANDTGVDGPRISPDGKFIAYGVRKHSEDLIIHGDDPARIYIRSLEKNGQERDLGVEGHFFSWSPESNKLAVTILGESDDGFSATHFIVDVKTGNTDTLNIPENHIITDWSPDGKSFLTWVIVKPDPNKPGDKAKGIVSIVQHDGSKVRNVSPPGQMAMMGRFSLDGKMILYTCKDPNDLKSTKNSIWVTILANGKSRKVTTGLNEEIMGACWSPDGKQIAYIWRTVHDNGKTDEETESFLDVIDLDGNQVKTLLSEKVGPIKGAPWIITLSSPDWR